METTLRSAMYSGGCHGKIQVAHQGRRRVGRNRNRQGSVPSLRSGHESEVFIEDGAHVKPGDVAGVITGRGEPAANGAPDVEHHATHERHCHHDG